MTGTGDVLQTAEARAHTHTRTHARTRARTRAVFSPAVHWVIIAILWVNLKINEAGFFF